MMRPSKTALFAPFLFMLAAACSDDSGPNEDPTNPGEPPETYEFESRFQEDTSSVSYSGQILRHVLIEDLNAYIGGLDEAIEGDASFDPANVGPILLSYYEFDSSVQGDSEIRLTTEPPKEQATYNDIAEDKDLAGKIAGQDGGGEKDHEDWSTAFAGWSDASISPEGKGVDTPDKLIRAFFDRLADNAQLQASGDPSRDGLLVYLTPEGRDLKQLIQKFLLMAVTFSQGTDDYLDEGLESDNQDADGDNPYTPLEHQWDEAFGYFGASRAYLKQDDAAIAAGENVDADGDGTIDLLSEYNFGASVNAAKRDAGSTTGTDFTAEAMEAFLEGRFLIAESGSPQGLEESASRAAIAWEKAIAATAVHYINDTLGDYAALRDGSYDFADLAKHWSELKGFALGLQFNPRSPLSTEDFVAFHDLIGDAPVLEDAGEDALAAYEQDLLAARAILQAAYEFADDDVENW